MNSAKFETILDTQKASAEAVVQLAQKSLNGFEQLLQLNLDKARSVLSTNGNIAKEVLGANNLADAAKASSSQLQTQVEGLVTYTHQLFETTSKLQKEMGQVLESQIKLVTDLVTNSLEQKDFPGSDTFSKTIKSMIDASNKTVENISAASKQLSEIAETNFKTVARLGETADKKPAAKKSAATPAA